MPISGEEAAGSDGILQIGPGMNPAGRPGPHLMGRGGRAARLIRPFPLPAREKHGGPHERHIRLTGREQENHFSPKASPDVQLQGMALLVHPFSVKLRFLVGLHRIDLPVQSREVRNGQHAVGKDEPMPTRCAVPAQPAHGDQTQEKERRLGKAHEVHDGTAEEKRHDENKPVPYLYSSMTACGEAAFSGSSPIERHFAAKAASEGNKTAMPCSFAKTTSSREREKLFIGAPFL